MHTASASTHNNAQFANANYVKNQHTTGDSASRFSTSNVQYGAGVTNRQSRWQSSRSSSTAVFGGQATNMNTSQAQSTRFGSANYSGTVYQAGGSASLHSSANQSNVHCTGGTSINTNRDVYKRQEINVPDYYYQPESQTVDVLPGQTTEVQFYNRYKTGGLTLEKSSELDKMTAGVQFRITGVCDNGKTYDQIHTTDETGRISIEWLYPGSYTCLLYTSRCV